MIFLLYFSEKISLDISCESSARQMIHIKCQVLFSLKNDFKKLDMRSATIFLGALKDNQFSILYIQIIGYFRNKNTAYFPFFPPQKKLCNVVDLIRNIQMMLLCSQNI